MSDAEHYTHIAWSPFFMRGKFSEWVKIGRGRIETDGEGHQVAHVYTNAIVRGDNGYICLMPNGKKPPQIGAQAKRPEDE